MCQLHVVHAMLDMETGNGISVYRHHHPPIPALNMQLHAIYQNKTNRYIQNEFHYNLLTLVTLYQSYSDVALNHRFSIGCYDVTISDLVKISSTR